MTDGSAAPRPPLRVCVAGVTGEVGRVLTKALLAEPDLKLTSAVARRAAGQTVGEAIGCDCAIAISASLDDALARDRFDVLVDYTSASATLGTVRRALEADVHVVVGSSGITAEQFVELDALARDKRVGVLHGNFAIGAMLAQIFATSAARYLKSWEIIEYAQDDKIDAVSGTARELASRLAAIGQDTPRLAPDSFVGDSRSRGATVDGTQVHALRLPGMVFGFEIIFGRAHERLTIRHEALSRAEPYIDGTLLAIRNVSKLVGVHRGLETVLDLNVQ